MDILGDGLAWLEQQRLQFLTRPVRYQRGALEIPVLATVGRTIFRLEMGTGAVERVESRDYLVAAAAIVAVGIPQRGDRLIEDIGGSRHTAEVLAPGREPHWRWSDPNRSVYRIHTKHLTTELLP